MILECDLGQCAAQEDENPSRSLPIRPGWGDFFPTPHMVFSYIPEDVSKNQPAKCLQEKMFLLPPHSPSPPHPVSHLQPWSSLILQNKEIFFFLQCNLLVFKKRILSWPLLGTCWTTKAWDFRNRKHSRGISSGLPDMPSTIASNLVMQSHSNICPAVSQN